MLTCIVVHNTADIVNEITECSGCLIIIKVYSNDTVILEKGHSCGCIHAALFHNHIHYRICTIRYISLKQELVALNHVQHGGLTAQLDYHCCRLLCGLGLDQLQHTVADEVKILNLQSAGSSQIIVGTNHSLRSSNRHNAHLLHSVLVSRRFKQ